MTNWKKGSLAVAAATLVVTLMAACGGGGGGSGGDGGSENPGVTGLVPAAPTPGTTLLADATVLRPLDATRQWTYAGTQVPSAGAAPVAYTNVMTQTNVTTTQATENVTNAGNNGPDSSLVKRLDGKVITVEDLDITGTGLPGSTELTELRSPVRVNDQYTSFDERVADSGFDVDRDGRADPVDLAAWVNVIGRETVTLADDASTSVDTVRITVSLVARLVRSSDGEVEFTVTGKQSVWYAESIGIVKVSIRVEEDATGSVVTASEVLSSTGPLGAASAAPQAADARRSLMQQVAARLQAAARKR